VEDDQLLAEYVHVGHGRAEIGGVLGEEADTDVCFGPSEVKTGGEGGIG